MKSVSRCGPAAAVRLPLRPLPVDDGGYHTTLGLSFSHAFKSTRKGAVCAELFPRGMILGPRISIGQARVCSNRHVESGEGTLASMRYFHEDTTRSNGGPRWLLILHL